MKTIISLVLCIILFLSCSKDKNPTPGVIPKADTLSSGWSKVTITGETDLSDIYFSNDQVGYASGKMIHKTTDGGNTWTTVSNLSGVNITGTPNGKIFFVENNSYINSLSNGGTTFGAVVPDASKDFSDIYFLDNNNGFASGNDALFFTTDGGTSWNAVQPITGLERGVYPPYSSVFFINDHTGWISRGNKLFHANGSVNDWSAAVFNPDIQSSDYLSIYATSANIVYVAGSSGKVFKSTDGGANFYFLTTFFSPSIFSDVHFIDDNTGYVSSARKVYKTSDGGTSWQKVATLGEHNLIEIYFTDASHGWACGDSTVLIYKQ